MKHDILSVKLYEHVQFEKKLRNFFSTVKTPHHAPSIIEIEPNVGVSIRTEKDHVLIPFPNVAGIYMNTEHKTKESEARKSDIEKPAAAQAHSRVKRDPVKKK